MVLTKLGFSNTAYLYLEAPTLLSDMNLIISSICRIRISNSENFQELLFSISILTSIMMMVPTDESSVPIYCKYLLRFNDSFTQTVQTLLPYLCCFQSEKYNSVENLNVYNMKIICNYPLIFVF